MQPIGPGTSCPLPPSFCDAAPAPAGPPPSSLLPSPFAPAPGDLGGELAALAVASGELQRAAATDARSADEARAQAEIAKEVQTIRAEAQATRQQACFDAVLGVEVAVVTSQSAVAGGVALAAKTFGDGLLSANQKDDEASARGHEAGVDAARFAVDGAHDALADARDFIRSALDFYKEYVATQARTDAAALRGG
jgi:hypothetical protein